MIFTEVTILPMLTIHNLKKIKMIVKNINMFRIGLFILI